MDTAFEAFSGGVTEQRKRDWKALYLQTAVRSDSSSQLKNRKRIVDCSQDLVDILLDEPRMDKARFTRDLQLSLTMEDPKDTVWRSIGGDFSPRPAIPNRHNFPSGMRCRKIYEQISTLPSSPIKTLAVTVRKFNGSVYISGMRFIYKHNPELLLGYIIPGKGKEKSFSLTDFRLAGFITAVGVRGIMALRAVSESGVVSDWLGEPEGLPVSIRLCMRQPIETLRGCFDVPYTTSFLNLLIY